MDLPSALAWLDGHIDLETQAHPRAGSTGGLSLERMQALVDVMGHPEEAVPVIHVTGTNGKGSTVRMVSALLAETGLSVGTYTSPDLGRLNERIARNGEPIADDELAELLSDLAGLAPLAAPDPSWFELVTAAAFRWFADVADVAVVEVGMLGRFDATNVADGQVAAVTNVGPDHTDFREGWRAAVAREKAGIVKPGATLVLGETEPELREVFVDEARRVGASALWERGIDFACDENLLAMGGRLVDLRTPHGTLDEVFLPLHGAHQGDNAAVALAATEAFLGRDLGQDVVRDALAQVRVPGRFEVVERNPLLVLDGAHNAAGAAVAAQTLADDFDVEGEVVLVVGALTPRDPQPLLEALDAERAHLVVACAPDSARAVPAAEVAAAAARLGVPAEIVPDVGAAVDRARSRAGDQDAVLVAGSLYVVAEARRHLGLR